MLVISGMRCLDQAKYVHESNSETCQRLVGFASLFHVHILHLRAFRYFRFSLYLSAAAAPRKNELQWIMALYVEKEEWGGGETSDRSSVIYHIIQASAKAAATLTIELNLKRELKTHISIFYFYSPPFILCYWRTNAILSVVTVIWVARLNA